MENDCPEEGHKGRYDVDCWDREVLHEQRRLDEYRNDVNDAWHQFDLDVLQHESMLDTLLLGSCECDGKCYRSMKVWICDNKNYIIFFRQLFLKARKVFGKIKMDRPRCKLDRFAEWQEFARFQFAPVTFYYILAGVN